MVVSDRTEKGILGIIVLIVGTLITLHFMNKGFGASIPTLLFFVVAGFVLWILISILRTQSTTLDLDRLVPLFLSLGLIGALYYFFPQLTNISFSAVDTGIPANVSSINLGQFFSSNLFIGLIIIAIVVIILHKPYRQRIMELKIFK